MNGVRRAFVVMAWVFARAEPPVAATSPAPAAADTTDLRTFRLCITPSCGKSHGVGPLAPCPSPIAHCQLNCKENGWIRTSLRNNGRLAMGSGQCLVPKPDAIGLMAETHAIFCYFEKLFLTPLVSARNR